MHSQYLGKDKVVGFAESTTDEVEVHELADYDEIKEMMRGPRNHISRKAQAKYKLPAVPIDNAFLTSPADIPEPRKVDLQDADVKPTTRSAFDELCKKYPTILSKGNEDIGRTQLIMMDIDTGDSPPVSSRPYTLALKHHQWVQNEIETLERAGVITKSMSLWASPIVVVPKKSQHGCKVPIMQGAFYRNYANLYRSPCSGIFVRLLHTKRALFFGEVVRVETFVRVLHSSRVNLYKCK